ncbi:hypothetical protein EUGRSUZ_F01519 [Eucalyptus grandis]|uniref:Uncharacterized protein n=2 Tax=Eucalyptus grandis TaxID=71139 RepID=A0ACC3KEV9_EUCGR|nr:hypothetical protein EUGRSUZ_F01519 [Eucalyptus grandis]
MICCGAYTLQRKNHHRSYINQMLTSGGMKIGFYINRKIRGLEKKFPFKPITASRDDRAYPISDNHQLAADHHLPSLAKLRPVRGSGIDNNQPPKLKKTKEQVPIKTSKFRPIA